MKKQISLYPKTSRFNNRGEYQITEKMDGSNMAFFMHQGTLYIASRKYLFTSDESNVKEFKGMRQWLDAHEEYLKEHLLDGSVIVGEWLGQGHIKGYDINENTRFRMFAKGNLEFNKSDEIIGFKNLLYKQELFIHPFDDQEIPEFIQLVPIVMIVKTQPSLEELNELYDEYCKVTDREVEGFIILAPDRAITKYVRLKNGKPQEHYK